MWIHPSYLAFRKLPIILNTVKKLNIIPDVYIFDGNGYLHQNNMEIATHASFDLQKPCIEIAKQYYKIDGGNFTKPDNYVGATTQLYETIMF